MIERRLEKWIDGSLQPVFPATPQISSARVPWSGFMMERVVGVQGRASRVAWPNTELIMVLKGGITVEERSARGCKRDFAGPGSITIWPANHEVGSTSWTTVDPQGGATEMIFVQLDPAALRLLTPEIDGRQVTMQRAVQDPVLASLMRLIEADVQTGCDSGRLYGESLSLALASRVLARYAATTPEERPSRTGLSMRQCGQVRDLVQANLDGDLSIAELARVAGLSPQHLTEAFRNTFGTTPHQYILRERIDQAKRLLATQRLSIADVAYSVGFATQSHFTAAFKRTVGVTPRHYRAAL